MSLAAVASLILAGFLYYTLATEDNARLARFYDASDQAAASVGAYVRNLLIDEQQLAERIIVDPNAYREQLASLMTGMRFDGGLLIDTNGEVLATYPHDPSRVGSNIRGQWQHLDDALAGAPSVSNVVTSALSSTPIVAFPTLFDSKGTTLVVSGGYFAASSPLEEFLLAGEAFSPCTRYLVGGNGHVIASNDADAEPGQVFNAIAPEVAAAMDDQPNGIVESRLGRMVYGSTPVPSTEWTAVCMLPAADVLVPAGVLSPAQRWAMWAGATLGLVALALLTSQVIFNSLRVRRANQLLHQAATTDGLTGLPNRAALDATLAGAWAQSARTGQPLGVAILDIDHFKIVNDTFGHAIGDAVLRSLSARFESIVRSNDVIGRWGGEEFLLIARNTSATQIQSAAERLRAGIASAPLNLDAPDGEPASLDITVSVGVAAAVASGPDDQVARSRLLVAADDALYEAKNAGRNCVRLGPTGGDENNLQP